MGSMYDNKHTNTCQVANLTSLSVAFYVFLFCCDYFVGEEDEVLWPHRPEERYGENTDARKDGRQAEKGQTSNDLVPGFERVDQAGHCWCITTGDRSGKMAKNHQSHSSADSAT